MNQHDHIHMKDHSKEVKDWDKMTRESEKVAYTEVPTQTEMLQYKAQSEVENRLKPHGDIDVADELESLLYEACQEGNIGGD